MMHVLREPPTYQVILLLPHGDGLEHTRVETGLTAEFRMGELVIAVAPDELDGVIATLRAAVGTARWKGATT